MKRREFLGAAAWLAVKPAFGQNTGTLVYPNAVPIVQDPAAAGFSAAQTDALFAVDSALMQAGQARTFPQSVASGDPSPHGIVLWTRVDPAAQGGNFPNQAAFQIAAAPDFAAVLVSGTGALDLPGKDNTVKLPIASGLQPFTTYYYRFIYNGVASRTGRFKTTPADNVNLAKLRLQGGLMKLFGGNE